MAAEQSGTDRQDGTGTGAKIDTPLTHDRSGPVRYEIVNRHARILEIKNALQPLAALEDHIDAKHRNDRPAIYGIDTKNMTGLTVGHIRKAAYFLR